MEEKDGQSTKPVLRLKIDDFPGTSWSRSKKIKNRPAPALPETSSGGLLAALYVYHRLLTQGEEWLQRARPRWS